MMGSPRLFDIDYRGGDELEIVLEASIGQYERRLTPDSTFGPYQAVRALLVYKESPCPPPPAWHTAGQAGLPASLGSRHEGAKRGQDLLILSGRQLIATPRVAVARPQGWVGALAS